MHPARAPTTRRAAGAGAGKHWERRGEQAGECTLWLTVPGSKVAGGTACTSPAARPTAPAERARRNTGHLLSTVRNLSSVTSTSPICAHSSACQAPAARRAGARLSRGVPIAGRYVVAWLVDVSGHFEDHLHASGDYGRARGEVARCEEGQVVELEADGAGGTRDVLHDDLEAVERFLGHRRDHHGDVRPVEGHPRDRAV